MSRIRVISGWVVLFILSFGWNFIFHGAVEAVNDSNQLVTVPASPLHAPFFVWIVLGMVWYALNWINIVNQWERRPVMLFGRYVNTLGPGLSLLEPLAYATLPDVSIQDDVMAVTAGNLQTKDNVPVGFVGILTYAVDEQRVKETVVNVTDWVDSLTQRALSTLTDEAASTDLNSLLEHREKFSADVVAKLGERVKSWGLIIKAFEIRDFKINDTEIEQALALKARATKEGEAELTRASMQKQIAHQLNEAAEAYTPAGWRLKGYEVLTELGRSGENNTLLLPTELTDMFARISASLTPAPAAK